MFAEIASGLSGLGRDQTREIVGNVGCRGLAKSVRHSLRHTGRPLAFVFGRRVAVDVSRDATVDLPIPFLLDAYNVKVTNQVLGGSAIHVSDDATFRTTGGTGHARIGSGSVLNVQGEFEMGNSYTSGHTRVYCRDRISIGDGCAIAWDVDLLDNNGNHELVVDGVPRTKSAPIVVEDDVWIGHHTTVHPGVTIGEGAVVASNSLVSRDVPPGTLAAGVPARVVKENVEWSV